MIWEMALPGPRVVYLEPILLEPYSSRPNEVVDDADNGQDPAHSDHETEEDDEFGPLSCGALRSQATPPALLYTCLESFEVASQFYTLAFETKEAEPETWFCFERDILVVDWGWEDGLHYDLQDFSDDDLKSLRKLAFFYPNNRYTPSEVMELEYEEFLSQCLEGFCNLETLYFTSWPDQQRMEDRSELALMDLRDIAFQNHIFSEEYKPEEEAKFIDECEAVYDMLILDNKRLNHFRVEWTAGGSPTWNIPEFHHSLIRTVEEQTELEWQKAEYKRKKELYYRNFEMSDLKIQ